MARSTDHKGSGWHRHVSTDGKAYLTTRWKKLRTFILRRDNYLCQCEVCKAGQRQTPATEVDHILPVVKQGEFWNENNLQAINSDCHEIKTQQDLGRVSHLLRACDMSGYPLDPNHPWNQR